MEASKLSNLVLTTTLRVTDEEDGAITMAYRVGAFDKEFWAWWALPNSSVFEALEKILTRTGITVAGEPVPPTADALRDAIPAQVAWAMWNHIDQERRAGKLIAAS